MAYRCKMQINIYEYKQTLEDKLKMVNLIIQDAESKSDKQESTELPKAKRIVSEETKAKMKLAQQKRRAEKQTTPVIDDKA